MSTWFGAPWPTRSNKVLPEELSPAFVLLQQRVDILTEENEDLRNQIEDRHTRAVNAGKEIAETYRKLSVELQKNTALIAENAQLDARLRTVGTVMQSQTATIELQLNRINDQAAEINTLRAQLARYVPTQGTVPPPFGPDDDTD